jgi:predicted small lipoprotein YifL
VVDGDFARYLRRVAVLALIACAATGCGRKGALEPPPSADTSKPKADQSTGGDEQTSEPSSGGIASLRAKKPKPVTPPKTSFILDPLL